MKSALLAGAFASAALASGADLPIAPYAIDTWTAADGLPQNSVMSITQTRDGYLWLATFNGLVRFDGTRFTVFDRGNVPGLISPRITGVKCDQRGRLWVIDEWSRISLLEKGRFAPGRMVPSRRQIYEERSGTVWVIDNYTSRFRWDGDHLTAVPLPTNCPTGARLMMDQTDQFWMQAGSQLGILQDNRFVFVKDLPGHRRTERSGTGARVAGDRVEVAGPREGAGLWMKSRTRMERLLPDGRVIETIEFPHPTANLSTRLFEDRRGNLWLDSELGELWCRAPDGAWSRLTAAQGLANNIRSFFQDHEGTVWFGTDGGGLHRLRPRAFSTFEYRDGFPETFLTAAAEDGTGAIWVGTLFAGLNRLENDHFVSFKVESIAPGSTVRTVLGGSQNRLWAWFEGRGLLCVPGENPPKQDFAPWAPDSGRAVLPRSPDLLSLALPPTTEADGGAPPPYRIPGEQFTFYSEAVTNYSPKSSVDALFEDRAGTLWMGYEGGLGWLKNGAFGRYGSGDGVPKKRIHCLAEDPDGQLWLGTGGGGLLKLRDGKFTAYTERDGLPHDTIRSLLADRDGTLWIGTDGGGLACYRNGVFTTIRFRDDLPGKTHTCILDDGRGCLWLTSYRGIVRVARSELEAFIERKTDQVHCTLYGFRDGLKSLECAGMGQPVGSKARDGRLWFPTLKGLSVVDPKTVEPNLVPPPIVIQEILVDGEVQTDQELVEPAPPKTGKDELRESLNQRPGGTPVQAQVGLVELVLPAAGQSNRLTLPADAPVTKEARRAAARFAALITPPSQITIPPGDHRLEISYAALSFAQPERNRYKYRLHGFDKDWVEAGTRRVAVYTALPPGAYRFDVLGSNNDGVWSETAASLAVIMRPFLWQRPWFLALAALVLIGGAVGGLRHLGLRRVRRKLEVLERQVAVSKERTRIARDIHDDLGARLTQIGLLGELARRKTATPEETLRQVEKITARTRTAVQAMDEIVWAVDPAKDTLDHLANYLAAFVREMFEDAPMRCQLDMPDLLPPHPLSAEVRHNLLLVVKEALHNTLKHSAATEVSLRLAFEGGVLTIAITDNGQGFDRATLPATTGRNGLTNMEQRVRSLGGEFALESRPGGGTRITLRMKLT